MQTNPLEPAAPARWPVLRYLSVPSSALRDPVLLLAVALVGGVLAWLSAARYAGYNAGMFDLGNMAQAIWSVSQGRPLLFSSPDGIEVSRLLGHAELIYFLLGPLYALWPDPRTLVVAQALLFALGAVPVYRMAARRTGGTFAPRALALIYLLYPTAQSGILFDIHGDTLAMPILLFMLDALDTRSWRTFTLFAMLALACKIYMAAPVAAVGAVMFFWGGHRLAGAITAVAAVVYGLAVLLVVRPLFLPPELGMSAAEAPAKVAAGYFSYYFDDLRPMTGSLAERALNMVVVFGPVLLVAWRGWRWLLPGLPITLAALISSAPGPAYDYRYHHYATVVPFIMMAAVEGVARAQAADEQRRARIAAGEKLRPRGRTWKGDLGLTVGVVLVFSALLVNAPLNPLFWLRAPGYGLDPSVYGVLPRDAVKDRFLAEHLSNRDPVIASGFLATRLVNREQLYLTRYPDEAFPKRLAERLPDARYVVADALFDFYVSLEDGYGGGLDYDRDAIATVMRDPAFALTAMRDGLLLFERGAAPGAALANQVERVPDDGAPALQQFGAQIALVRAEVAQAGPRRLRASFTWRLAEPLPAGQRYVAVSRLEGVPHARFVNLPSYALLPAWQWRPGELVREVFEVELPAEVAPGSYSWRLGWYDVAKPAALLTDRRSLMPGSEEQAVAVVEVR